METVQPDSPAATSAASSQLPARGPAASPLVRASPGSRDPHLDFLLHFPRRPETSGPPRAVTPEGGTAPSTISPSAPKSSRLPARKGGPSPSIPTPRMPPEWALLPSKAQTHSLSKAWRKSSWSAWTCSIFGFFTGNTAAPAAAAAAAAEEEEAE